MKSLTRLAIAIGVAIAFFDATCAGARAPTESQPDMKKIITRHLWAKSGVNFVAEGDRDTSDSDYFAKRGGIFRSAAKIDHLEISKAVTQIQTNLYGWAWQTCIRLNLNGTHREYAVFVARGQIVDARTALVIDGCDRQSQYEPVRVIEPHSKIR